MAITCASCGHWSLNGEHDCPAVRAHHMNKAVSKELFWQQCVVAALSSKADALDAKLAADDCLDGFRKRFRKDAEQESA